jgi:hypothetical protein
VSTAPLLAGIRLGKKQPKYDPRTLMLARYIEKRAKPKIPQGHNLSRKTLKAFPKLGLMVNDSLGDCTVATLGHGEQTWSTYGGAPKCPTDAQIVAAYDRVNGGVDEGAYMLDVLNLARHDGIGGNRIFAFVGADPLDHDQIRTGHFLFGGLCAGANLPVSAQDQLDKGVWDVVPGHGSEPGSWGGHEMYVIDYVKRGPIVVTWGQLQSMTWAFWDRYVDEVHCVLSEDWIGADKRSPQGFSLSKLAADMKQFRPV